MATEPNREELARLAAYSGEPWKASNKYFAHAETAMDRSWEKLIYPFIMQCDFTNVVDLACGHGRNSAKIIPLTQSLIGIDFQESNIDVCRQRFASEPKARFFKNNGFDIAEVADEWATLIYTFDAMVHFEPEVVRSYLADIKRALRPGGQAFLHHSNYTGGRDWRKNPASRNFMSVEMMAEYARAVGLTVIKQTAIDWSTHSKIDGLSLLGK